MSNDLLGLIAIAILIAGVIAGVMSSTILAWILILAGIGIIVFAKLRK